MSVHIRVLLVELTFLSALIFIHTSGLAYESLVFEGVRIAVAVPPATAPVVATATVPPAIPNPPADIAPPPNAASEAFVRAAPESVPMAVPVLAVPKNPLHQQ